MGECTRMQQWTASSNDAQGLRSSLSDASAGIFGGNQVCSQKALQSVDVVQRYTRKVETLIGLSSQIQETRCSRGCSLQWIELTARTSNFNSCLKVMELHQNP